MLIFLIVTIIGFSIRSYRKKSNIIFDSKIYYGTLYVTFTVSMLINVITSSVIFYVSEPITFNETFYMVDNITQNINRIIINDSIYLKYENNDIDIDIDIPTDSVYDVYYTYKQKNSVDFLYSMPFIVQYDHKIEFHNKQLKKLYIQ